MSKVIAALIALAFIVLFIIVNSGGPSSTPDDARQHDGPESARPAATSIAPAAPLAPSAPAASVAATDAPATGSLPAGAAAPPAVKMTTRRPTVVGAPAASP